MWRIESIQYLDRVLDFTSSGQGQRKVTALHADGACLVNALSLLEFADDGCCLQIRICEDCGVTHCQPGGWICARRLGGSVLWIPCFEAMESDPNGASEFAPPFFERGMPYFRPEKYGELRGRAPGFPALENIPRLRSRDAVRVLQMDAPGRVLGQFPARPSVRADSLIASDTGDLPRDLEALQAGLAEAWELDLPLAEIRGASPVSFFVDIAGTPRWTPAGRNLDATVLALDDSLFVALDRSA